MLYEKIRTDMQGAMKERDATRLNTLRFTLTALTNEVIASGKKPTDTPDDETTLATLKRLVKQRKESATLYREANQTERAEQEDAERAVLESYLPPEMSEEEVQAIVSRIQQEKGISEKKDMGTLMKAAMQEMQGKVDGAVVSKIVNSLLS